jgi:hypothetical protein
MTVREDSCIKLFLFNLFIYVYKIINDFIFGNYSKKG